MSRFVKDRLQIAQRNITADWRNLKAYGIAPAIVLLLGSWLSPAISLAAFYGAQTIVIGNNKAPSVTESFGLALLSTALAGVILLLVKPRSAYGQSRRDVSNRRFTTAELLGYSFIMAAMAFALFGLLSPFLSVVSEGQRFFPHNTVGDFSEMFTRWIAGISLITGTVSLVMPLSFGPFLFVADLLVSWKKKKGQ